MTSPDVITPSRNYILTLSCPEHVRAGLAEGTALPDPFMCNELESLNREFQRIAIVPAVWIFRVLLEARA